MADTKVIFMGSAELSCASLSALQKTPGMSVAAVVTQPDKPKGRHLKLTPSPVKERALETGLPVLQPRLARDPAFISDLRTLAPDLVVVVAYGQILPPAVLEIPPSGCINVHTSLLPRYRGAGPIQRAILNGDAETGVTIMKMDAGLDTGPILSQERTGIGPEDDARTLHDRLAQMGASLLVRTIPGYLAGNITPQPQPAHGVSYAPKITKQDGQIDWSQPASVIWNKVRGLTPWPGAFTFISAGGQPLRLKILKAIVEPIAAEPGRVVRADKDGILTGCGKDALKILQLQIEGGRPLNPQQFLAGHELPGQLGFSGAAPSASIQ